ncbi:MAG TPA: hypothetical protein VNN07_05515 [Candidatus Tectomicrobia bacterium]|nr:hypothetical protein [Candidatus Tectomicrobia bacterium]
MPREIDFSGGVRGKYVARYQRWTSVTSAVGTVNVTSVASEGDKSGAKLVLLVRHSFDISPQNRIESVRRITREALTAAAHAR